MTPDKRDAAQYASDVTALILTAGAAAALLLSARNLLSNPLPHSARSERAIELTLQSASPEAPPAPAPPPPPRVKARRTASHPTPPAVEALPVENDPVPVDSALVAAYAPTPAPAAQTHPDIEAQYAAELRSDIERRNHPPDSPQYRLHHPSGEVRVRFLLLRSGEPQAVAVLRSSGSSILDEQALKVVSSGHYPTMPTQAFIGEEKHLFVVTVEFRPPPLSY